MLTAQRALATILVFLFLGLVADRTASAWSVRSSKERYDPGESITIYYSNFSDPKDWISVVKANSASNHYVNGYWSYISSDSGAHTFKGLPAGTYEVRAYCCWGSTHGGYGIRAKQTFTVGSSASGGSSAADCDRASVNGTYSGLIQTLHCPRDSARYGEFDDWGHWRGGAWCGQTGLAGYWVWVAPNWYVWSNKR